jgi:hypothetical protein
MKKVKKLLLLAIFFTFQHSFSQSNTSIEGKWRILAISDHEMYYNIKKDSLWLSEETMQSLDSTLSIETLTELHKRLWQGAKNSFLIFGKKAAYQEIEDGKITATGIFTIDKRTSKLKLDIIRNKIPVKSQHHFQIKGNELHLVEDDNPDATFVWEKVTK